MASGSASFIDLVVIVSLGGDVEGRETLLRSAVTHDVYGGTWVWENVRPNVFIRGGVQVMRVA